MIWYLVTNMVTDMRQTALPFMRNLSSSGEGREWEERVESTHSST